MLIAILCHILAALRLNFGELFYAHLVAENIIFSDFGNYPKPAAALHKNYSRAKTTQRS